ncbi:hypothetical protein AB4175_24060, partial [Vibrio cyclitrophicus]
FHGNIKERLPQGGAGMVPDIMFSGVEVSVETTEGENEVNITLPANAGGTEVGTITLAVSSGAALAFTNQDGLVYRDSNNSFLSPIAGSSASALLRQVPGYDDIYNGDEFTGSSSSYPYIDVLLTRSQLVNQFHARAFVSKSAVVSFPSANIPTTWSASLPITVTVQ